MDESPGLSCLISRPLIMNGCQTIDNLNRLSYNEPACLTEYPAAKAIRYLADNPESASLTLFSKRMRRQA